jgi:hypothetical protein
MSVRCRVNSSEIVGVIEQECSLGSASPQGLSTDPAGSEDRFVVVVSHRLGRVWLAVACDHASDDSAECAGSVVADVAGDDAELVCVAGGVLFGARRSCRCWGGDADGAMGCVMEAVGGEPEQCERGGFEYGDADDVEGTKTENGREGTQRDEDTVDAVMARWGDQWVDAERSAGGGARDPRAAPAVSTTADGKIAAWARSAAARRYSTA